MKRTTVCLPDIEAVIIEREARRRGLSISSLMREAVLTYLGLGGDEPRHIPFAAVGRSGYKHTGRDAEEVLAAEWDPSRDR